LSLTVNRAVIGKSFRQTAKVLCDYLAGLDEAGVSALQTEFQNNNGAAKVSVDSHSFDLTSEMVSFKQEKVKINGRNYTPSVIEPSFGIGRIMYSLLEHSYYARASDANRTVVGLSPVIAPVKCSVLPLQQNAAFGPVVQKIFHLLTNAGISAKVDDSATTIGKRYARTDEIGIPFGITVDFETIEQPDNATVTLRERDSTSQIRIPIANLVDFLLKIVTNQTTWEDSHKAYPSVASTEQ
jgi:glycyl-tRNA synthetase